MRLRVGGSDERWKVKERKASSVYNKLNVCAQETPQARSLYLDTSKAHPLFSILPVPTFPVRAKASATLRFRPP